MRIVVTGAAGFVGSHLCEGLVARGHEVVGLDCFAGDRAEKAANVAEVARSGVEVVEADLRTSDLHPLVEGADVVVNEAAATGLFGWDHFDRYQGCNLTGLERLVQACAAAGVGHLVQASTSSVYGVTATGDESSPTAPISPYGVTKLAAEHLLRAHAATEDLPFTILRYFSVYGPRQRPDMAFRIILERLRRDEPIPVYGDGEQSRTNTYVDDCVAATIAAAERAPEGDTFNIGGSREMTLRAAIDILAAELGVEPRIDWQPARPGDQRRTRVEAGRAREVLGWVPRVDPSEGLRRQAAWLLERAASGA